MQKFRMLLLMICQLCLFSFTDAKADSSFEEEIKAMKIQMAAMQSKIDLLEQKAQGQQNDKQVYEKRIQELETQLPKQPSQEVGQKPMFAAQMGGSTLKLMDISFDSLFTVGGSTAREDEIARLEGGSHDPKKRGFTTQNLELSMLGAVDPYFNAESHLVFQIDSAGESKVEVEEAFITTQELPYGFQAKAGTFFAEFGRLNPQHPHSWDFVDQPVINSRLFGGDGLRGPGARLSWLSPLPWYSEFLAGVHNANGETAFSFLSKAGEDFSGYTLLNRDVRSARDLLYSTRWLNSWNLSDELTMNFGTSALFGPNASGFDNRTNIYGTDIYLKWQPISNDRGFPFVGWQTEVMKRDYEAGNAKDDLDDWGLYTQLLWGFKKNWVCGLRYDFADGNGASTDSLRDRRFRLSPNLTWYPTEFSKLRLQYNYDDAKHLGEDGGEEHSVWLQFEFMLGSHPKHKF